jgi:hypothetical protein
MSQDTSKDSAIAKVRRAKPADLTDACWTREERSQKIVKPQVYGSGRCERLYPSASVSRGVAGASIAADVIKCQLKPIDAADYKVTFTPDEMAKLKTTFAAGVCDWSKPGVEQLRVAHTWPRVLVDVGNQKVVFSIGKSGILWKLDRTNGKMLGFKETVLQNVYDRIDPTTGVPHYRADIIEQQTGTWVQSCPSTEAVADSPLSVTSIERSALST